MTLTSQQLDQLVENYAERIVDDMDTKCLIQFVYDTIVENLSRTGGECDSSVSGTRGVAVRASPCYL
jgi:hypothetical protein